MNKKLKKKKNFIKKKKKSKEKDCQFNMLTFLAQLLELF